MMKKLWSSRLWKGNNKKVDKGEIESEGPEVETKIRGIEGALIKNVIDQIGEEVIAMNIETDQGLNYKNKRKRQKC